jgi:hypothetical protein
MRAESVGEGAAFWRDPSSDYKGLARIQPACVREAGGDYPDVTRSGTQMIRFSWNKITGELVLTGGKNYPRVALTWILFSEDLWPGAEFRLASPASHEVNTVSRHAVPWPLRWRAPVIGFGEQDSLNRSPRSPRPSNSAGKRAL